MKDRREFLKSSAAAAAAAAFPFARHPDPDAVGRGAWSASGGHIVSNSSYSLDTSPFPDPVIIESIEVVSTVGELFVRVISSDGVSGTGQANSRLSHLLGILEELVIPFFVGKDAREIESLVGDVYRAGRNYKYAGLPFWNCVGHVELSILDMLGRLVDRPVASLFGETRRDQIAVYISNFDRAYSPEETVARLQARLEGTGAHAIKLKVGGRMSRNADSIPGRTEALIPLARKVFGDDMTIYTDSNGSYDASKAVEIGRILEEHDVALFEEPCEWQDYEATKEVADALSMTVAGGEQDTSLRQFAWMIQNRVVDLIQPDMVYNGGFVRALRVAEMAEEGGIPITPHSPTWGPAASPKFHFASIVRNIGPFQEHRAGRDPVSWCSPNFSTQNGLVRVPDGPGWGISYDPGIWHRAKRVV